MYFKRNNPAELNGPRREVNFSNEPLPHALAELTRVCCQAIRQGTYKKAEDESLKLSLQVCHYDYDWKNYQGGGTALTEIYDAIKLGERLISDEVGRRWSSGLLSLDDFAHIKNTYCHLTVIRQEVEYKTRVANDSKGHKAGYRDTPISDASIGQAMRNLRTADPLLSSCLEHFDQGQVWVTGKPNRALMLAGIGIERCLAEAASAYHDYYKMLGVPTDDSYTSSSKGGNLLYGSELVQGVAADGAFLAKAVCKSRQDPPSSATLDLIDVYTGAVRDISTGFFQLFRNLTAHGDLQSTDACRCGVLLARIVHSLAKSCAPGGILFRADMFKSAELAIPKYSPPYRALVEKLNARLDQKIGPSDKPRNAAEVLRLAILEKDSRLVTGDPAKNEDAQNAYCAKLHPFVCGLCNLSVLWSDKGPLPGVGDVSWSGEMERERLEQGLSSYVLKLIDDPKFLSTTSLRSVSSVRGPLELNLPHWFVLRDSLHDKVVGDYLGRSGELAMCQLEFVALEERALDYLKQGDPSGFKARTKKMERGESKLLRVLKPDNPILKSPFLSAEATSDLFSGLAMFRDTLSHSSIKTVTSPTKSLGVLTLASLGYFALGIKEIREVDPPSLDSVHYALIHRGSFLLATTSKECITSNPIEGARAALGGLGVLAGMQKTALDYQERKRQWLIRLTDNKEFVFPDNPKAACQISSLIVALEEFAHGLAKQPASSQRDRIASQIILAAGEVMEWLSEAESLAKPKL